MTTTDASWELERQSHYARLREVPHEYERYHALFELHRSAGWIDAACCIASTLGFLGRANAAEVAYLEEHHGDGFRLAQWRLSEDTLRRHVAHPDRDLGLTDVFGLIAPAVAAWRAKAPPTSIAKEPGIDLSKDPSLVSRMIEYVRVVLDVERPDVVLCLEEPGDAVVMNLQRKDRLRPTLVVSMGLARGKSEPQLAYGLGRSMLDLHAPHFCSVALDRSPQALEQVLMACLHAACLPAQGDEAALDQIAREIFGRMQPAAREQLRSLLQKLTEAGGSIDVERWVVAAEQTAYRVGLLLCGDLRIAGPMISQEQAPLGVGATRSPQSKLEELVLYSISEDYFTARRAIGVDVQ